MNEDYVLRAKTVWELLLVCISWKHSIIFSSVSRICKDSISLNARIVLITDGFRFKNQSWWFLASNSFRSLSTPYNFQIIYINIVNSLFHTIWCNMENRREMQEKICSFFYSHILYLYYIYSKNFYK